MSSGQRRHEEGGGGSGRAGGPTGRLDELLSAHFLGEFELRLRNVTCANIVRETSSKGLQRVEQSVRSKGWMKQFAPSVVVPCASIPEGGLTAAHAVDLEARVLDGNHRVKTCQKLFDADYTIPFRVYKSFNKPADEKLIADCE